MGNQSGEPFVSCIMPTANRRAFVPRTIACFLRKTTLTKISGAVCTKYVIAECQVASR